MLRGSDLNRRYEEISAIWKTLARHIIINSISSCVKETAMENLLKNEISL